MSAEITDDVRRKLGIAMASFEAANIICNILESPMETLRRSDANPLRKARSVNQTSASFVAKLDVLTEPSGDAATATGQSVIDLRDADNLLVASNGLKVRPYGVGANNTTFKMRVLAWKKIVDAASPTVIQWTSDVLGEVLCTISSTCVGIAGGIVNETQYYVDTITFVTGNANISIDINSPADNTPAHIVIDTKGCEKIELSFATDSSATSCNALYSTL